MINGGGASESIQQRGFKYIFQTAARISAYVDGIDPLMKKYNVKSMAFVSRDYSAARDMDKVLKGMAQKNTVTMVMDEYFPSGNVDFASSAPPTTRPRSSCTTAWRRRITSRPPARTPRAPSACRCTSPPSRPPATPTS
jgi:hypothetical protein